MNTRIKTAMQLLQSDGLNERIETILVMKVKSDYLNYDESDAEFEIEGVLVTIVYEGMQAFATIHYEGGNRECVITFNDLDECIMNFEYLN